MKKITLLNCLVCLLLLFPMMGHAQVNNQINDTQLYNMELPKDYDGEVRDSFYYMKDDGEFSDDEKDDEAMYILIQSVLQGIVTASAQAILKHIEGMKGQKKTRNIVNVLQMILPKSFQKHQI